MAKKASDAIRRIREIDKAIKDARKELEAPKFLQKLGEMAAAMVKLRTRLGYGVSAKGAQKRKLKPLAQSTRDERAGKVRFFTMNGRTVPYTPSEAPRLHAHTSPGMSNLTRTGQLLDSIRPKKITKNSVTVGPSGDRGPDSTHVKAIPATNAEVGALVEKGGRPFNYLSKVEIKRAKDFIAKEMKRAIQTRLTKRKG